MSQRVWIPFPRSRLVALPNPLVLAEAVGPSRADPGGVPSPTRLPSRCHSCSFACGGSIRCPQAQNRLWSPRPVGRAIVP
ncbi:Uncharacterised protein [Mycobacteroides abscessus subsp. abscessus]|nr:Uncharacterised protein [Mycobacteroides abscessus subsp. abscessus]